MTLALQSKLVRDFKTPLKAASAGGGDKDPVEIPKDFAIYWADGTPVNDAAERNVLRETARDLAADRGLDRETAEWLESEALERFERDSVYPLYSVPGALPFHKLVARICEDLGLKPDLPPARWAGWARRPRRKAGGRASGGGGRRVRPTVRQISGTTTHLEWMRRAPSVTS